MASPKIPIKASVKSLEPSATLVINEKSKTLLADGKKVYKLGFGQSPFPIPKQVVEALQYAAHKKDYLPVRGLQLLREEVAKYYQKKLQIHCEAADVMIGPGSKELILILQLACKADLILPSPSWVSYEPQANLAQNKVIWVSTGEKENWLITPEKLEEACLNNLSVPKIIILNYPSNPVGVTYNQKQLKALAVVAKKHQLLIVADEIYGELTFSEQHFSIAQFYPEGTIISGGLSKWCGAGGWRLGTFTFPAEMRYLLDTMATIASESFSAVSAPVQFAAITAYKGSIEIDNYLFKSNAILKAIAEKAHSLLAEAGVSMPLPQGGFYLFPNFKAFKTNLAKKGVHTSTDFCELLLKETGVALLPGVAFGRPDKELTCRLSYVDFNGEQALKKYDGGIINDLFLLEQCPLVIEGIVEIVNWLKKEDSIGDSY